MDSLPNDLFLAEVKFLSWNLYWCSWYVRISRRVHFTVHTNSAVCAATDSGQQLEDEGEAVYDIPVGDAEAANAFGVDGGSVEHGDQVVRVGSSEASPVWDNAGPVPEQLSSIVSGDKSG